MKKTTYIIIALIISNFILIAVFFIALHTTERPRPKSSEEDEVITIQQQEEETSKSIIPFKIIVECNGKYYLYINQGYDFKPDSTEVYNEATMTLNTEDLLIHHKGND